MIALSPVQMQPLHIRTVQLHSLHISWNVRVYAKSIDVHSINALSCISIDGWIPVVYACGVLTQEHLFVFVCICKFMSLFACANASNAFLSGHPDQPVYASVLDQWKLILSGHDVMSLWCVCACVCACVLQCDL